MRGALILLEGVDRSGKSTQTRMLVEALNAAGNPAHLMRFPDRTSSTGKLIDAALQGSKGLDGRCLHLLFSANRWEKRNEILRLLHSGVHVVMDRYAFSGIVFSVAAQGLPLPWCLMTDSGLPKPDLTLFLSLPIQDAAARGGFGEEIYETEDVQTRVARLFGSLSERLGWSKVSASRSIEAIHKDLWDSTCTAISKIDGPVGELDLIQLQDLSL